MQKTEKKKEKRAGRTFQYISLTQYTKYNNILNKCLKNKRQTRIHKS